MSSEDRRKPDVLICGTIRNGGARLSQSVKILKRVFEKRFRVHFFLVESDSTDSTVRTLAKLSKENSEFEFKSLGTLSDSLPNRLQRLARCRNEYIEFFESSPKEFEFLVVADFDGVNSRLTTESLRFLDDSELEWAAAFANQDGPYYDLGALRIEGWVPKDPFKEMTFLVEAGFRENLAHRFAISSRMHRIPLDSNCIRVSSAYGGLAIYKSQYVAGCRYSTGVDNEVEIVEFNKQFARKSNGSLCIVPSFVNARYTEHTSQLSFLGRHSLSLTKGARWILRKILPTTWTEKMASFERRLFAR